MKETYDLILKLLIELTSNLSDTRMEYYMLEMGRRGGHFKITNKIGTSVLEFMEGTGLSKPYNAQYPFIESYLFSDIVDFIDGSLNGELSIQVEKTRKKGLFPYKIITNSEDSTFNVFFRFEDWIVPNIVKLSEHLDRNMYSNGRSGEIKFKMNRTLTEFKVFNTILFIHLYTIYPGTTFTIKRVGNLGTDTYRILFDHNRKRSNLRTHSRCDADLRIIY